MPFVYLVRCRDGSYYAGAAKNLDQRLAEHNAGRGARYTRARLPVVLAWSTEVPTWGDALREEARIKKLRRTGKEALMVAGSVEFCARFETPSLSLGTGSLPELDDVSEAIAFGEGEEFR